MGYLVEPMVGIGAYKFGMTLEQIQNLLPNGYRTVKNRANKIFSGDFAFAFQEDVLVEISVLDGTELFFEGKQVFVKEFKNYMDAKYTCIYKFGSQIYDDVGIALQGFSCGEVSLVLTLYAKGHWDSILNGQ